MAEFSIGERVNYILPKDYVRDNAIFFPATIVNVTKKRIVIRIDGSKNHRNVLAVSLRRRTDQEQA